MAGVAVQGAPAELQKSVEEDWCSTCESQLRINFQFDQGDYTYFLMCGCANEPTIAKRPHPIQRRYEKMIGNAMVKAEESGLVQQPKEVVELATAQADALMDVVERQKLFAMIDGRKYLEAEAWEIILAFNNISPVEDWTRPVHDGEGNIRGFESRIKLLHDHTGNEVGGATMVCGFDDFPCRGKTGTAQHKAAMSAAQTWAVSKAARLKVSWVATLAGYQPTPASEMVKGDKPAPEEKAKTKSAHGICPEHGVEWFQSKNMQNPAHPTDAGRPWCNKPEEAPPTPEPATEAPRMPQGQRNEQEPQDTTLPDAPAEITVAGVIKMVTAAEWEREDVERLLGKSLTEYTADGKKTPAEAWQRMKQGYEAEQQVNESKLFPQTDS